MPGIPRELYTPVFAIARIIGWSAHRIEELINADKIIRPEYTSVVEDRSCVSVFSVQEYLYQSECYTLLSAFEFVFPPAIVLRQA